MASIIGMSRWKFVQFVLAVVGCLVSIPIVLIGLFYLSVRLQDLNRPELVKPPTQGGEVGAWQVTNRLKQRFPVGSDARLLVAYLEKEKFRINLTSGQNSAVAAWSGLPCGGEISVFWKEDSERKILEIRGSHSIGCL